MKKVKISELLIGKRIIEGLEMRNEVEKFYECILIELEIGGEMEIIERIESEERKMKRNLRGIRIREKKKNLNKCRINKKFIDREGRWCNRLFK